MSQSSLIYKVCRAYYEKGLTQQVIADRYGVSRIKVSRLLAKAQKEKIVQINIVVPKDHFVELENKLEDKYGLDEVIIIEKKKNNPSGWIHDIGRVGAEYINSIINGKETIALSWGRTLLSVIDNLPSASFPDLKVVQMLGGIGEPQSEYHGVDLARRFADSFGTRPTLIQSPGIVKNKFVCDELKSDLQIREALQTAAKADIAIMGLGVFSSESPIVKTDGILTEDDFNKMINDGIVGDMALRFFNGNGEYVKTGLDERIVELTFEEISNIPRKIGIAGGNEKYEVIRAVARGKLVNVLITDSLTAQKLLKED